MSGAGVGRVYLVVHEFFCVSMGTTDWTLVTPDIAAGPAHPAHKYELARFKEGLWTEHYGLSKHATYGLDGVAPGMASPLHDVSPLPPGKFPVQNQGGFCRWTLPRPSKVHQLRLTDIGEPRPLFTGKDGAEVESRLEAASLVQVLEYEPDGHQIQVVETPSGGQAVPIKLDCDPDPVTQTVNLHLFASLEHDSHANDNEANDHATHVFNEGMALFPKVDIATTHRALAVDAMYRRQNPMPPGLRFTELVTLAERNRGTQASGGPIRILCGPRTCGVAGNVFIEAP